MLNTLNINTCLLQYIDKSMISVHCTMYTVHVVNKFSLLVTFTAVEKC